MQDFSASPNEMVTNLWRYRELIWASTKREVLGRYRGSTFGLLWSFFNPVFMLVIYTFVFSVVFKARWSGGGESKTEFALVLFAGLIVFNLFVECVNRAPSLILSNANYVKKVVFPLEILPVVGLLSAFLHALVSLCAWLLAYVIFFGVPPATTIYLPLVWLPFLFFIIGVSWVLASLGVYLRDVGQIIGLLTTVLMFISPIFYPITSLPENYHALLSVNPLALVIEQTRSVLYFGKPPNTIELAAYWAFSIVIALLGFAWFQKTRKGFADVL